eukprot:SAG31_NODE_28543_length_408_cov_1.155340_1_plen_79_part_10
MVDVALVRVVEDVDFVRRERLSNVLMKTWAQQRGRRCTVSEKLQLNLIGHTDPHMLCLATIQLTVTTTCLLLPPAPPPP